MGFFSKVAKSFSADGQIEVNITTALQKIKKASSKRNMMALHARDNQFFWWFAYGIATRAGSLTNPYASNEPDYYKKVFRIIDKSLSDFGMNDTSGGSHDLQEALMHQGSQYMFGVKNFDKHQYNAAISAVVDYMKDR